MRIIDMQPNESYYTQLGSRVLAVLVKRHGNEYAVYVDAVPGDNHEAEWPQVKALGLKQKEPVARAIVENLFHPGFDVTGATYSR